MHWLVSWSACTWLAFMVQHASAACVHPTDILPHASAACMHPTDILPHASAACMHPTGILPQRWHGMWQSSFQPDAPLQWAAFVGSGSLHDIGNGSLHYIANSSLHVQPNACTITVGSLHRQWQSS
eukprot:scaffold22604_cov17-Tisochrysis_lutea.AAC.1